MSKRQTRLLVVPQVRPPRGVVVATGEEVAVGAPPAHVPRVGLGPRFDDYRGTLACLGEELGLDTGLVRPGLG